MQKDFHYYLIYALCRDCGFSKKDTEIIAYASQYVDDCNEVQKYNGTIFNNEIQVGNQMLRGIITQTFSVDTLNEQNQYYVLIPFHFIPGNNPAVKIKGQINRYATRPADESVIADQLFDEALQTGDNHRIGVVLHAIADTFSHQNFNGMRDDWNSVYPWYSPYSVAPNIGHAEVGQLPDTLSDGWTDNRLPRSARRIKNAQRALKAIEYIFTKLFSYKNPGEDGAAAWAEKKSVYGDLILGPAGKRDNYDYDVRLKAIRNYLNLPGLKYKRDKWLKAAIVYDRKTDKFKAKPQPNFMKSDFWLFQLAAQAHVSATWETMAKYAL